MSGWVESRNYARKAINYICICKCTITITIQTLNIILRGLDLWTVLRTFMSRIGESPSGRYLMSAFPPPLKACPIRPSWQPQDRATHKTNRPRRFRQYLTLWKSNCVKQITSVRAEEEVVLVVGERGGVLSAGAEELTRLKAVMSQVLWGIICEVAW